MDSKPSGSAKVKVTASLDAELVKYIDDYLKEVKTGSRSQFIEDALRRWHNDRKRRQLEDQIEEYYLSISNEEQEEDRNWHKIATRSADHLWEE